MRWTPTPPRYLPGPPEILAHRVVLNDPGPLGLHHLDRVVAAAGLAEVHDGVLTVASGEGAEAHRFVAAFHPDFASLRVYAQAHHAEDVAAAAGRDALWHALGQGLQDDLRRQQCSPDREGRRWRDGVHHFTWRRNDAQWAIVPGVGGRIRRRDSLEGQRADASRSGRWADSWGPGWPAASRSSRR